MRIKEIGEFKLIERMSHFLQKNERVVLGIGDDCAALKVSPDCLLIATTDILIERIHFHLEQVTPKQLAFKSLAVNLSDIASMGARPLYALVSLGVPSTVSVEFVEDFYRGLGESGKKYNVSVVGGDTSSSKSGLIVNIVLLGEQKKELIVRRSGAKAGDSIFVTGTLGDSAAGLRVFKTGRDAAAPALQKEADFVLGRHSFPEPRLGEGKFLAENRLASSMIDLSDGVASDIRRLCEQSRVGARIFADSIPFSSEMKVLAESLREDPLDFALYGGEDYELMFTVAKKNLKRFGELREKMHIPLSCIGEIVKEAEGITLVKGDSVSELGKTGYEHFRNK
jgi:thiamine-monophosphate kinase